MMYNSNFDNSSFQKVNWREFNKTIDDPCAVQQRNDDNNKKIKFITTNHVDLLEAKTKMNFFGIDIKDQLFVPTEQMETFGKLRQGETGNIITNCNVKNGLGQLPLSTVPSRYQLYHGDIEIEDRLTEALETNRQTSNPRDVNFHQRSFTIFEGGVEVPSAIKSIEPQAMGPRGGQSTRYI